MKGENLLKVLVNTDLCAGNGVCEAIASAVFTVGEDGLAHLRVDQIPPEMGELAADAVASCPAQALRLERS